MITIGEVAANVTESFYIEGHPQAYTFAEHIHDRMEAEGFDESQPLRYQGDGSATCKYCHEMHSNWELSGGHFPPCWICQNCDHATDDRHMEIEG